jgi:uncharacterized glyoxalase superfamily protein PhnB
MTPGSHEASAVQDAQRPLHGTLRQAGLQGDLAVAHPFPLLAPAHGTPPEEEVDHNVKSTYEELKARSVEFTQPPKKEPWGEHAIFKDSEGNLVLFGTA